MKKLYLATLTGLLLLTVISFALAAHQFVKAEAASTPRVSYERWIDDRTVDVYVQSPSTDSWNKEVRLLLPKGWSKDANRTWPALWLLHGGADDYTSWTKGTDIEELSAQHDMMVVIPNTSWCSSYSDWWNYGKGGSPAWETYITSELRGLMETKYHADGSNATIAGLSMGGLGAVKLAMYHTDMFKAAASFSGNLDPLHAYNNTSDAPDSPTIGCMNAPDTKKVWGDYKIPAQRAMWERNDPYVQASKLANLDYLFVSSGDGLSDPLSNRAYSPNFLEKQTNVETQALVKKLNAMKIPVESDFYAGVHSWPYWEREMHKAFPNLLKAMNVQ